MAIPIGSNFLLGSGLPLDSRTVVTNTTARDAIPSIQRYDGLVVYTTTGAKQYQLQGGILNANWVDITVGASSQWITSGSNIYYNTGKVSIGTSTAGVNGESLIVLNQVGQTVALRLGTSDYDSSLMQGSSFRMRFGAATGNTYVALQPSIGGSSSGGNLILNDFDGNVGIRTMAPANRLTVERSITSVASQSTYHIGLGIDGTNPDLAFGTDASYTYIQSYNSKPLQINQQGNNTIINGVNGGNVGIGTTSPGRQLHVASLAGVDAYVKVEAPTGKDMGIVLARNGVDNTYLYNSAVNDSFRIYRGGDRFSILTNGNVGMGTTSPAYSLDIEPLDTISSCVLKVGCGTAGSRSTGNIYLQRSDGLDAYGINYFTGSSQIWFEGSPYNAGIPSDQLFQIGTTRNVSGSWFSIDTSNNWFKFGPTSRDQVTIFSSSSTSATTATSYINLGESYSDTPSSSNLKIILHSGGYGITVGSTSDVQFHTAGQFDWYHSNTKVMSMQTNNVLDAVNGYISSGNAGGTGSAAYFPSGLYAAGTTAWIFGTVFMNGILEDTGPGTKVVMSFTAGTLSLSSTATASNFILSSDRRLKTNIRPLTQSRPVTSPYVEFELIAEPGISRVGQIAQDLEIEHPEFIRTDKNGIKSVAYTDLHSKEIADLKTENTLIKDQLKLMMDKIMELERKLL